MFGFRRLLNASNGKWYCIVSAKLATDEFDFTKSGGNAFTVDLQPINPADEDEPALLDLTLSVSNDGYFAQITRNLDKEASVHERYSKELMMPVIEEDMMDCLIERDLLIVTTDTHHE